MVDIMCVLQEVLANEEVEEPIRSFAAIKQVSLCVLFVHLGWVFIVCYST